jgi:hypothetical protein
MMNAEFEAASYFVKEGPVTRANNHNQVLEGLFKSSNSEAECRLRLVRLMDCWNTLSLAAAYDLVGVTPLPAAGLRENTALPGP